MRERRKNFLVNKQFQLQFAFFVAMQSAIPIILFGASLYVINKLYLTSIQIIIGKGVIPDSHIAEILTFSVFAVLAMLAISAVLLFYISIRFSHHIAGPIHKLENTIDNLMKGEKAEPLKFRKDDAVPDAFASKLNVLIEELNKSRK